MHDVTGQIPAYELRRKAARRRLGGHNLLHSVQTETAAFLERPDQLRGYRALASGPDGENHGQARHRHPFGAEIVEMPRQGGRIDAQGRVADDQRRVGDAHHGVKVRGVGDAFGDNAVAALEEHAHQFHAGARTGVQGERANPGRRAGGNQQDAAHRAVTGDAGAGDDLQVLPGQFERGNDADIGGAGGQLVGTIRGKTEFQIEPVALGPMEHAPYQGSGIQITDRRYARPMRDSVAQPPVYQTVYRVLV